MASSDEEDLEALRMAALASLKKNQAPQGIQVLQSVGKHASPVYRETAFEAQSSFPAQPSFPPQTDYPVQHTFPQQPTIVSHPTYPPQPLAQNDFNNKPPFYNFQQQHRQPTPPMYQQNQPQNAAFHTEAQPIQRFQAGSFANRGGAFQGKGFPRGRVSQRGFSNRASFQPQGPGRGRGFYGNLTMSSFPPNPGSSLIVIQVEGAEKKKPEPFPQSVEANKKPRPLLLRPQDKWASTDGNSSQCSTPTKPKDTSKFRRYDDDTDSEEEDEAQLSEGEDTRTVTLVPGNDLEDISLDDSNLDNTATTSDLDHGQMSANITIDEIHSDINTSQTQELEEAHKSINQPQSLISNKTDQSELLKFPMSVGTENSVDMNSSAMNPVSNGNIRNVITSSAIESICDTSNKIINTLIHNEVSSTQDSTPLRDEVSHEDKVTPLRDELRPDDISNSYSSFSRFNRRRKHSESGDESDIESEEESKDNGNSRSSSSSSDWSKKNSDYEMVSEDSDIETENVTSENLPVKLILVKNTGLSETVEHTSKLSRPSPSNSLSPVSSSSHTSSSSSSSSSRQSSPETPPKRITKSVAPLNVQKSTVKNENNKNTNKSVSAQYEKNVPSNKSSSRHSRSPVRKPTQVKTVSPSRKQLKDVQKQRKSVSPRKKEASPIRKAVNSSNKNEASSKVRKEEKASTKKTKIVTDLSTERKKLSQTDRDTPKIRKDVCDNTVKADPEFDAANYRDSAPHKKGREQSKDNNADKLHGNEKSKRNATESSKTKPVGEKEKVVKEKETRYFKEISKLKEEEKILERSEKMRQYYDASKRPDTDKRSKTAQSKVKDEGKVLPASYRVDVQDKPRRDTHDTRTHSRYSDRDDLSKKHGRRKSRSPTPDKLYKKRHRARSITPVKERVKNKSAARSSKSETHINEKVKAKTLKVISPAKSHNKTDDREKLKKSDYKNDKKDRRSGEKRKSLDDKSKRKSLDEKSEKKEKRKSIEERLKKIANIKSDSSSSSSDSESDKSISSLSDVSSDSETETWRNKKSGASRNSDDIERERRRRMVQEREKKREEREKDRDSKKSEKGNGDFVSKGRHHSSGNTDRNRNKDVRYDRSDRHETRKGDNIRGGVRLEGEGDKVRGGIRLQGEDFSHQKYYHKKGMTFYEEKPAFQNKTFEETNTDSDSDVPPRRGLISVIKTDKPKQSKSIPSLLDIKVSRSTIDKDRKTESNIPKRERLVIHMEQSSDEEVPERKVKTKKVAKQTKRKKSKYEKCDEDSSHGDDAPSVQQVVNVSFDNDIPPRDKSRPSVYDRLGIPVHKKSSKSVGKSSQLSDTKHSGKTTQDDAPSGGKRIKLNESGKYAVRDKHKKKEKLSDEGDVALNMRIQKIQEKNAEILRRKMEIEQDKQKYG